jgi:site-specific recombinase XerD
MTATASLAPLLQSFFTSRLIRQKQASPHTIGSYRDTFRLLLRFVEKKLRKPPSRLLFDDVEAPLIVAFLDELEARPASARAAATCDLRRFDHFSIMLPSSCPHTLDRFSGCWRSLRSVTSGP